MPDPGPGEVAVRIRVVGVCCSDRKQKQRSRTKCFGRSVGSVPLPVPQDLSTDHVQERPSHRQQWPVAPGFVLHAAAGRIAESWFSEFKGATRAAKETGLKDLPFALPNSDNVTLRAGLSGNGHRPRLWHGRRCLTGRPPSYRRRTVDDPQVGKWRCCIDQSIGAAERGDVGRFSFSGAKGSDRLGDVFSEIFRRRA